MKSFFVVASFVIAVSVACTSYKSAGSQAVPNNGATSSQTPAQTTNASSQEKMPCTLTLAGAPTVNGLRLGMTTDEVLAVFPGSKEDVDLRPSLSRPPSQFGQTSFVIRPDKYESKANFAGISQISFSFLDARVSNFSLGYNGPEYPHVDELVEKFVQGTTLPGLSQWDPYAGMDNTMKVLKCAGFEVNAFIGGEGGNLNHVLVKDLIADQKLKDRRKKAREQATPTPGQ